MLFFYIAEWQDRQISLHYDIIIMIHYGVDTKPRKMLDSTTVTVTIRGTLCNDSQLGLGILGPSAPHFSLTLGQKLKLHSDYVDKLNTLKICRNYLLFPGILPERCGDNVHLLGINPSKASVVTCA